MKSEMSVRRRLAELHKNIRTLQALRVLSILEIATSTERIWALEHGLQISVQIVLDIGNQLLAERGENDIDDYADVIARLGTSGILPLEFSEKIKPMAGFRNLLVHEYIEVDLKEVYRVLQENLSDFEIFGGHVEAYLAKDKS